MTTENAILNFQNGLCNKIFKFKHEIKKQVFCFASFRRKIKIYNELHMIKKSIQLPLQISAMV